MDPELERQKLIAAQMRQKTPMATLDPTCVWVPTIDEAASAALDRAPAERWETGGVLYKNDAGEYCYSIPVGNSKSMHLEFQAQPGKGFKIAGLYHTHPFDQGEQESEYFSPNDIEMSGKLKMPSYIKLLRDGTIKKYVPGSTATMRVPYAGRRQGLLGSIGEVIRGPTDVNQT